MVQNVLTEHSKKFFLHKLPESNFILIFRCIYKLYAEHFWSCYISADRMGGGMCIFIYL